MGSCLKPSQARCVRVRLADVPEPIRIRAAREVCAREYDETVKAEVLMLALCPPPSLVAWVRP